MKLKLELFRLYLDGDKKKIFSFLLIFYRGGGLSSNSSLNLLYIRIIKLNSESNNFD